MNVICSLENLKELIVIIVGEVNFLLHQLQEQSYFVVRNKWRFQYQMYEVCLMILNLLIDKTLIIDFADSLCVQMMFHNEKSFFLFLVCLFQGQECFHHLEIGLNIVLVLFIL